MMRISKERGKSTKYLSTFEALKKEFLDLFFWTKGLDQHYFLFNFIFSLMQHLILNKGVFFLRIVVVLVVAGFQNRTVRFFRCRNNFRSRETRQPASAFRRPWSAATEAARPTAMTSETEEPGWPETA